MSVKKQENRLDAMRDAATGYAVVVLGIVCFVLVLAVVMTGVRIISGVTANAATTAAATVGSGSGAT